MPPAPASWPGWLLGGLATAVYFATAAPGLGWYDSAEFTAAAATWGIPHAPGYPLYTLLAWIGCHGPFEPATVTNGLSVLAGGVSVSLAWFLGRRIGAGSAGASFGAALLAVSPWLWANATVTEVYAPGLCILLGVFLLLLKGRSKRSLLPVLLAAGLAGLGLGVHYMVATCGLGFALLVFLHLPPPPLTGPGQAHLSRRLETSSWQFGIRTAAACGLWAAAGASINYALLSFRLASDPAVNSLRGVAESNPVGWLMLGGNYRNWWGGEASVAISTKLAMLGTEFALQLQIGCVLAGLGLLALWRADRILCGSIVLAIAGNIAFFLQYEVHDLENFFLPSLALLCILAGRGLTWVQGEVSRRLPEQPSLPKAEWLLMLLPLLQLGSWSEFDRSDDDSPERYLESLDESLPLSAVLIRTTLPREWQYDTLFTVWHQQAMGQRDDVRVLTRPLPTEAMKEAAREEIRMHAMLGRRIFVLHPDSAAAVGFQTAQAGSALELVVPIETSPAHPPTTPPTHPVIPSHKTPPPASSDGAPPGTNTPQGNP